MKTVMFNFGYIYLQKVQKLLSFVKQKEVNMSKYEIIITKNSLSTEDFRKIQQSHDPMRPEVIDWYRRIQMSCRNPIGRVRSDVKIDFSTQSMTYSVQIYNIEALNTNPINNYRSHFLNCDN